MCPCWWYFHQCSSGWLHLPLTCKRTSPGQSSCACFLIQNDVAQELSQILEHLSVLKMWLSEWETVCVILLLLLFQLRKRTPWVSPLPGSLFNQFLRLKDNVNNIIIIKISQFAFCHQLLDSIVERLIKCHGKR